MNVSDIFTTDNIVFDNTLKTKEECLEKLAELGEKLSIGTDKKELLAGFIKRENEFTTGFGDGIAIPHTKCSAVKKAGVLVLKNENGMEWMAMDDKPVYIAIALLVPDDEAATLHMKLLSSLSRKLINKEFKSNLLGANNKEAIYSVLVDAFEGK